MPDPRGRTIANSLDSRLHSQRMQNIASIRQEVSELRQTCTNSKEALNALEDYFERFNEMAYEVIINQFI